jgi:predicted negative regulator of RcsB-dependent stress response
MRGVMKCAWKPLALACSLVIGIYAYMTQSGLLELLSPRAAETPYNLLVQGFREGHLSLAKEVPAEFIHLADPYDPTANDLYRVPPHRMLDLSYYKGRLYLYFGITPALILFWPFVALTGHYLLHRDAVTIFCASGFLASAGLLWAIWRRYFAEVSVGVVTAGTLALGLATGVPALLSEADVYQVPISCGYMLTMLALGAVWRALHEPERSCRWLALASVVYGLAVGARPNLLFGAVILLVPVAQAWHERRQIGALLIAATGPIVLIGLGLLLYNALRFDNPFEFGMHYALAGERQVTRQLFSLHYLWFNFRVFFLEPARWSTLSPYIRGAAVPFLPAGYAQVRNPYGILTNIPLVWMALAVPLAWRSQPGQTALILRWFVTAVALLFGACALTIGLFWSASFRYEVDFLPALILLAVVGILGFEYALAGRLVWRRAARWGWGLMLGFSVAFNLLASVEHYAEAHSNLGTILLRQGHVREAVSQFEQALRIDPDYNEALINLGSTLLQMGQVQEAIARYEQAVRIHPGSAEAYNNLGVALAHLGRVQEAIENWRQALRINPDYADAHRNLEIALGQTGNRKETGNH